MKQMPTLENAPPEVVREFVDALYRDSRRMRVGPAADLSTECQSLNTEPTLDVADNGHNREAQGE